MLAKTVTRSLLCLTAVASALPHNPKTRQASYADDSAVSESNQPEWYHRNLKTIQTIYDYTVYPANTAIIAQGSKAVPPGLFAPNATGRVSPVGNFTGFEDSIEYFFALAPTPQGSPASTAFYKAEVVDFVSGCPNVASSLVYFRTGKLDEAGQLQEDGPKTTLSQVNDPHRTLRRRQHHSDEETVLSQVAFFHFNDAGEVDKYQAWIPNLQKWVKVSSGIDYTNMQVQQAATQQLCPQIQKQCTGANQQFSSVDDCAAQLGAKPFGDFDEAWGDNIACRTIHTLLTIVRPDIHCPHVGPTGGGKCVDIDYSDDYFDDAELFGEALGSTFTCSGPIPPSDNAPAKMAQQALLAMGGNPSSIADAMAALPVSSGSDQHNTINKRGTPPPTPMTYDDKPPAKNETSPPSPPTKPPTDTPKKPETPKTPETPKMPESKSYGAPPAKNETSPPSPPTKPPTDTPKKPEMPPSTKPPTDTPKKPETPSTKPPTDTPKKPEMPPTTPPAKNDTNCETPPAPAPYGKQPSAPPTTPPTTPKSPVTPPSAPPAAGYGSGSLPAPVPGSNSPTAQSGTGLPAGAPVPGMSLVEQQFCATHANFVTGAGPLGGGPGTNANPAAQSAQNAMTPPTVQSGTGLPAGAPVPGMSLEQRFYAAHANFVTGAGPLGGGPGTNANPAAQSAQNAINGVPPQTVPGQGPGRKWQTRKTSI